MEERDFTDTLAAMRRDWDERAIRDAEQFIYTRDSASDEPDFDASGRANYNQLVRPFLPVFLEGRDPGDCRALEIGCGVGRMTRWFAAQFGRVDALDVSEQMVRRARGRLSDIANVSVHLGSGGDLTGMPDGAFDLVFSYIVFQHIPLREIVAGYVREAARVLRPRGVFKFQINGDTSVERPRDTWHGAAFTRGQAEAMLKEADLEIVSAEGAGTQYFVLTTRKGPPRKEPSPRPYILPGEEWAAEQLLEGFGPVVEQSWRPMGDFSRVRLGIPDRAGGTRFFVGLYFWPADPFPERRLRVEGVGEARIETPGDHYFEWPAVARGELGLRLDPGRPPAFRCLGYY